MKPAPVHVDDAALERVCDLRSMTAAIDEAFGALGRGDAASSPRVRAAAGGAMASAMAAALPARGVTGAKCYATVDGRFTFLVALFDLDGRLLATFAGDALTRLRTAATTGVALRYLARPEARVATLFGTGRQSALHVDVLAQECALDELRIVGRSPIAIADLIARGRAAGIAEVRRCEDAARAVDGADVVVTVTSSTEPLFPGSALAPGTLVCGIGATKDNRREIDSDTVAAASSVVLDAAAGAREECGDLVRAAAEGRFDWGCTVELADVVAGRAAIDCSRGVLFESQGIALEDVAGAELAWRRLARG